MLSDTMAYCALFIVADAIPSVILLVLMPDTTGDVIDADRSVTDVTISIVDVFCVIASVGRF